MILFLPTNLCYVMLTGCEYPCWLYPLLSSGVLWCNPPRHFFFINIERWMYVFVPARLLRVVPSLWSKLGMFLCCTICHWKLSNEINFSLLTAYVWIEGPESTLVQHRYFCLHSLVSNFWRHGCSLVPGCVARISVAPSDGEQPDPGAPRCRFPCFSWSMMLYVYSETNKLLSLLDWW